MPALLTSASMRFACASVSATALATEGCCDTSTASAKALAPSAQAALVTASLSRSHKVTLPPEAMSRCAMP